MSEDNDYVFILQRINFPEKYLLCKSGYTYICGNNEENDILCKSKKAAKYHCTFFYNENEVYVTDLKSKHKTFVNGVALEPYRTKKLCLDDIICIGYSDTANKITKDIYTYILRKFQSTDQKDGKSVSSPAGTSSSNNKKTANSKTEADKVDKLEKNRSNSGSKSLSKMPKSQGKDNF